MPRNDELERITEAVRSIDLTDVASWLGMTAVTKTKNMVKYHCPMPGHNDTNASFTIHTNYREGHMHQTYICYGCKQVSGEGAVSLAFSLHHLRPELECCTDHKNAEHMRKVVCWLAAKAHIDMPDIINPRNWFRRATKTDANETGETVLNFGKMDFFHIQSLGLDEAPDIERLFRVKAVDSYVTVAKDYEDGRYSWKVRATDTFPVLAFEHDCQYVDINGEVREGKLWMKYEPEAKEGKWLVVHDKAIDKGRGESILGYGNGLWCDAELEEALRTGVVTQEMSRTEKIQVNHPGRKANEEQLRFKRIIICSGPRDAINVFYRMKDCHVCWPSSESMAIQESEIRKLMALTMRKDYDNAYAYELYVLYDADETGRKHSRVLCLNNPDVREIILPDDLGKFESRRTGKAAKDVSEYFEVYKPKWEDEEQRRNIERHFEGLIGAAQGIRFWNEENTRSLDMNGRPVKRYTLNPSGIAKFLSLYGYRRYKDGAGQVNFVKLFRKRIIQSIPADKSGNQSKALIADFCDLAYSWLDRHTFYGNEGIKNVISTSMALSEKTVSKVPMIQEPAAQWWSASHQWLFFENVAVKVEKEQVHELDYEHLPFYVFADAIRNGKYVKWDGPKLLMPKRNPNMGEEREKHQAEMRRLKKEGLPIVQEKRRWARWKKMNEWKLDTALDWEDMPATARMIRNSSSVFWRDVEEYGHKLTAEEMQIQSMHTLNKFCVIGYLLCHDKGDGTDTRIVHITDYAAIGGRSTDGDEGRGGKSLLVKMLSWIVGRRKIDGKQMSKDPERIALDISVCNPSVDSILEISDPMRSLQFQVFYNMADSAWKFRTLYNNPYYVPFELAPKIVITANWDIPTNHQSVRGRLLKCYTSDYYHEENEKTGDEAFTPKDEFGFAFSPSMPEKEWAAWIELCIEAMQWHMKEHAFVEPPLTREVAMRQEGAAIGNTIMTDWLQQYFGNGSHWDRFIAKRDVYVDYLQYYNSRVPASQRIEINGDEFIRMGKESSDGSVQSFSDAMREWLDRVECAVMMPVEMLTTAESKQLGYVRMNIETYPMSGSEVNLEKRELCKRVTCFYFKKQAQDTLRVDDSVERSPSQQGTEVGSVVELPETVVKKTKAMKHAYGSHRNVRLTDKEYEKLCELVTEDGAKVWIEQRSQYKLEKVTRDKSDYLAIRRWIAKDGGAYFPKKPYNDEVKSLCRKYSETEPAADDGPHEVEEQWKQSDARAKQEAMDFIEIFKRAYHGDREAIDYMNANKIPMPMDENAWQEKAKLYGIELD